LLSSWDCQDPTSVLAPSGKRDRIAPQGTHYDFSQ
jgi:hypothetical protein